MFDVSYSIEANLIWKFSHCIDKTVRQYQPTSDSQLDGSIILKLIIFQDFSFVLFLEKNDIHVVDESPTQNNENRPGE